eukprot:CAMPEP_0168395474 /NCGR_PEP_ID=MMETSP0228-20121227/20064_1 /TAXON_ID=133427 /ORGANISM="Protoceratium reticulatum, Strain CCCM 535 (=CCMP 1889)" /LENGTH=130 /DNA_ID=CAMNT_0008408911 /DNA_START=61 /DNA_END=453 /DNA_ORIENTATION=-
MAHARARSPLALLLVAAAALGLVWHMPAFVPAPAAGAGASERLLERLVSPAAAGAAVMAAATAPPAFAQLELEQLEDDEGFDFRILAVVLLPAMAISWALFNVWRVAARQLVRIGESTSGSSKIGLLPED